MSASTSTSTSASRLYRLKWTLLSLIGLYPVPRIELDEQVDPSSDANAQRMNVRRLYSLLRQMWGPFWASSRGVKLDFAFVVFLLLLNTGFTVGISYVAREFWNALSDFDQSTFYIMCALFLGLTLLGDPIYVWYNFKRNMLAVRWRHWLSNYMLEMYYSDRKYYIIEMRKILDNPDQRLSEDLKRFTEMMLVLGMQMLTAVLDVFAFSWILIMIYPPLFFFLLGYALFGTLAGYFIGRRLILLEFYNLMTEAELRYSLMRVRENAESIAFYKGENREFYINLKRLFTAIQNDINVFAWQRNLDFFTQLYTYLVQVIPVLVMANKYFDKSIKLGVLQQAWAAFNAILHDLSVILYKFEEVSRLSAGLDRLGELCEYLKENDEDEDNDDSGGAAAKGKGSAKDKAEGLQEGTSMSTSVKAVDGGDDSRLKDEDIEDKLSVRSSSTMSTGVRSAAKGIPGVGAHHIVIVEDESVSLQVSHLTLYPPDDPTRILISDLNLNLPKHLRLLIVGPSGTGKSSLLRALAGLWNSGSGVIRINTLEKAFFLPQQPYTVIGDLFDNLCYPRERTELMEIPIGDLERLLASILCEVNLPSLLERMGGLYTVRNWKSVLSLGEQQRVAFARLLVSQHFGYSKLVILDEATSSLDLASERYVYSLMKGNYISVGHRPSLLQYHDLMLKLSDQGWSLLEITDEQREYASRMEAMG